MAIYKRDKNWYIDYYVHGRRRREKIGPSKRQAETILQKRKVEIAENRFLDVKKQDKIRFDDFAKTYLEVYSKPNKKSWQRDEEIIRNALPSFGDKYLYEIISLDVENYKRERKEKVSAATVNRELTCLKNMFNKAIEWGKTRGNPVTKVKFFRVKDGRLRYLEKEEIRKLLDACSEPLRSIITVAVHTGMRRGEILNLKWKDINLSRKIIYIFETKSGEKREIPMNEVVYMTFISIKKHLNSPYIFCNKEEKPYKTVRSAFERALKKARINDFRFHDLRHTFASHLVMMGIDLKTVQELLGHKTFSMTLRYAHLSADHKKAALDYFCKEMDTIWTPRQKSEELTKKQILENASVIRVSEDLGR